MFNVMFSLVFILTGLTDGKLCRETRQCDSFQYCHAETGLLGKCVCSPGYSMTKTGTCRSLTESDSSRENLLDRLSKSDLATTETAIKRRLFRGYDRTSRPVNNQSAVFVRVGMTLFHILDTNEKFQTFSALISVRLRWRDLRLAWNPSQFSNLTKVFIPGPLIWTPDIVVSNNAGDNFLSVMKTNAVVQHTGSILWMYPAVIKTYCTLDVRHFPFDTQKCTIMFISWTYSGLELDLHAEEDNSSLSRYNETNQEWSVPVIIPMRHNVKYACCEEPYPDVTFTMVLQRRSMFYVFNLIFPCMLIYFVAFLGFFLPVESNDKVNLEITILLALVVFLMVIAETLPPTPDAIPLLGMFFGATMVMLSVALVMSVVATNVYFQKDTGAPVPIYLSWLGRDSCCLGLIRFPSVRSTFSLRQTFKLEKSLARKRQPVRPLEVERSIDHPNRNQQKRANNNVPVGNGRLPSAIWRRRSASSESLPLVLGERRTVSLEIPELRKVGSNSDVRNSSVAPMKSDIQHREKNKTMRNVRPSHSHEWVKVARRLDYLFFWVFVCASVAVLSFLFIQIPR